MSTPWPARDSLERLRADPNFDEHLPWTHMPVFVAPASVACDPARPSDASPVPHAYALVGYEYASLAAGGSYEVLLCLACGRVAYTSLPD